MSGQDLNGRNYAGLSTLKEKDVIELDGGFGCATGMHEVFRDDTGLYFKCAEGNHYLAGQADDGEHCVGVYLVTE